VISRRTGEAVSMQRLIQANCVWLKRHVDKTYLFGLTESYLDNILDRGDIDSIDACAENGIRIQWSGLKVTEGDELYHCQYTNIYGTESFQFPDGARIVELDKGNALLGKYNRLKSCSKTIGSIPIGKVLVNNLDLVKAFKLL